MTSDEILKAAGQKLLRAIIGKIYHVCSKTNLSYNSAGQMAGQRWCFPTQLQHGASHAADLPALMLRAWQQQP